MTTMPPSHHHDDPLTKRVLERISDEHVRPRWEFVVKNYFFWGLGALAVLLGALAVSAILFEVTNVDWRLASATHGSLAALILAAAPYLWIVALIVFVVVGYRNVRLTSRGYRYRLSTIALGAVLTSLTLGSALHMGGFSRAIEESIGDHPAFYRPILATEQSWWNAPEKGLIGGVVTAVAPDIASFTVRGFDGATWQVDGDDLLLRDRTTVARGGMVRIVGVPLVSTSTSGTFFHACFVFPFAPMMGWRHMMPPPPLATLASTSGHESPAERSAECRGIQPYHDLRQVETDDAAASNEN